jgi:hypothetical protein
MAGLGWSRLPTRWTSSSEARVTSRRAKLLKAAGLAQLEEEREVTAASAQAKAPWPAMMAYRKGDSGIPTRHWRSASRRWGWWTWRRTGMKETAARTAGFHPR